MTAPPELTHLECQVVMGERTWAITVNFTPENDDTGPFVDVWDVTLEMHRLPEDPLYEQHGPVALVNYDTYTYDDAHPTAESVITDYAIWVQDYYGRMPHGPQ